MKLGIRSCRAASADDREDERTASGEPWRRAWDNRAPARLTTPHAFAIFDAWKLEPTGMNWIDRLRSSSRVAPLSRAVTLTTTPASVSASTNGARYWTCGGL